MENNKPIKTFRIGSIGASVLFRSPSAGYEITLSSQSYSERHLDTMIDVLIEVTAWIEEQKANAKTATIAA